MSGLNLIPLAPGKICFTGQDVEDVLKRTEGGRVAIPVTALSIESPVRRLDNVAVPLADLEKILAPARAAGLGLHLDGARLPLYAPYFDVDPASVAALFDTVYVSLYKCFSAPSGAILAGPAHIIDELYHARRMFGGGMNEAWLFAAVALHHLDEYSKVATEVVALAEDLFARLNADGRCKVSRVPDGTNVFHLNLLDGSALRLRQNLLIEGVELPMPEEGSGIFTCKMNPTWGRTTADKLERVLLDCL